MFFTRTRNTLNFADGLDGVELVEAVEETFNIEIADRDAERMQTVGQLHDYLCKRLDPDPGGPCLTARSFRRLTKDLHKAGQRLRPSTSLERLAGGPQGVVDLTRELQETSGLRADMSEAHGLVTAIGLAMIVLPVVAVAALWPDHGPASLWWIAVWLMIWPVTAGVANVMPRHVPDRIRTVGDLVHATMARNYPALASDGWTGTKRDVWHVVCCLCRDFSGHSGPIDRETTFYA